MRSWLVIVVLAAVGCGAQAGSTLDDAVQRAAYRTVVSAPIADALDVYHSRGEAFPDFPRVKENVCTGYVGVDSGDYEINVRDPADSNTVLADLTTNFAKGGRYIFVTRIDGSSVMSLSQHLDDRTDAGVGNALLSFVNATTDGAPIDVTELVGGVTLSQIPPDHNEFDPVDEYQVSVPADVPVPLLLAPGGRFVTEPLPSNARMTVVVRDSSAKPSFVVVAPVNQTNESPTSTVRAGGQLLLIDNWAEDNDYGTIVPFLQQKVTLSYGPADNVTSRVGTLPPLDLTSTFIAIASAGAANDALTFATYRDTTSDGAITVINSTTGLVAPDVTLVGTAITYSDVIFGAALSQAVSDPTSVTGVTATDTSGTFTYHPQITAQTRFLVFIGSVTAHNGIVVLDFANDVWTSTFAPAQ